MNDNNNKKQDFYTECPKCKEKLAVSINIHNEPQEVIEKEAERQLAEKLKQHLAEAHTEESKPICLSCSKEIIYPCFGGNPHSFTEKWHQECFAKVEKDYRGSKDICYITKEIESKISKTGKSFEGDHIIWKKEKGCWIKENWKEGGVKEEIEVYRPVSDKKDNPIASDNEFEGPVKQTWQSHWKCNLCGEENKEGNYNSEAEATAVAGKLFDEHINSTHPNYGKGNKRQGSDMCEASGIAGGSIGTNVSTRPWKCLKCGWEITPVPFHDGTPTDLNAIQQKHEQSGECEKFQQTDHYKCLKCGKQGRARDLEFIGGWCRCGSKNLEMRFNNFHWTIFECLTCHKVQDMKYHGLSAEHEERMKKDTQRKWEDQNSWCGCPRSNNSSSSNPIREREREREREQIWQYLKTNNIKSISLTNNGNLLVEYQNGTSQTTSANNQQLQQVQSYLQNQGKQSINQVELQAEVSASKSNNDKTIYWIFGGIAIVFLIVIGILIYFLSKKQKDKGK